MATAPLLIRLPDWPSFLPAPENEQWADFKRLARSSVEVHHAELNLLLARVHQADPDLKGPDGTPLLTALLAGWGNLWNTYLGDYRDNRPLALLPLPGEAPWDRQGEIQAWELPAAALIARGAHPFEEGPDGLRPWDVAVQTGAAAVVDQMLRHPACPRLEGAVDWERLRLRWLEREAIRHWNRIKPENQNDRPTHPLEWAVRTHQEHLTRVLARAGAGHNPLNPLFWVDPHATLPGNAPEIIAILVENGASPTQPNQNGLLPIEAWSLAGILPPNVRAAWGKAAARYSDRGDMPRAVAAALFANAGDALRLLPGKPRGLGWKHPPFGAPEGLSWVEWAALGILARTDTGNSAIAANTFQSIPLSWDHLSERERAWTDLVSHVKDPHCDNLADAANDLTSNSVRRAWHILEQFNLPKEGLIRIVGAALEFPSKVNPLMAVAADLLRAGPSVFATLERLSVQFLKASTLRFFVDVTDDTQLPALVQACARAFALPRKTTDDSSLKDVPSLLAALFAQADTAGLEPEVLDETDRRALREAQENTRGPIEQQIGNLWGGWLLKHALPETPTARRKARL